MSDDLQAALKMEYFDVVGGNEWVVIPRVLKEKLIERLDRDRKMKAELAERLTEARRLMGYVPFWAKMATQAEGGAQMHELSEAKSIVDALIEKLEAADSKTEASE